MNRISRRRFSKLVGLCAFGSVLGLSPAGCGKNPVSSREGMPSVEFHDDEHGNFETLQSRLNGNSLTFYSNIISSNITIHSSLRDLDVRAYCDVNGDVFVSGFKEGYLPAFAGSNSELDISLDLILQILNASNQIGDLYAGSLGGAPTFDFEGKVLNIPGIEYIGDYSFNQIKTLTNLLNDSVSIIVPVFPGLAPISIATNIIDSVAYGIDDLIDFMNEKGLSIDKNEEYEFYRIPWLGVEFFMPKLINGINYSRKIENYLRVNQGDWWLYNDGRGGSLGVEVRGYKRIQGKQIPIFEQTDGVIAYQGFEGHTFYTYGIAFNNQEIILSTPIKCGDDRLAADKSYRTTLEINGESVTTRYHYQRIENPYGLHDENQFPDSWKFTVDGDLAFISRGVGQTRIRQSGLNIELKEWGSGNPPWRGLSGSLPGNMQRCFVAGISSCHLNEQFYKSFLFNS